MTGRTIGALTASLMLGAAAPAPDTPPNVVVIVVDDLGYHDLGHTGSPINDTPRVDRLAAQSARMVQGYASYPRCTPSRYGLMTATYPVKENKGNLGAIPAASNFVQAFEAAGYDTRFVGKWHLGDGKSAPVGYGFDGSFGAGSAGGAGSHFYPFNTRERASKKGDKAAIPDVKEAGSEGDNLNDVLTDDAIRFLRADREAPFLVMLNYYAVHTPIEAAPEDEARNAGDVAATDYGSGPEYIREGTGRRKMRQDDAAYAAMVERMDDNVGRVLDALEAEGLAEDTIVVFTSDHGGLSNDGFKGERHLPTTNLPLRAGKGWLYEGGIRVPLFVRWPGQIAPRDETAVMLGMDVGPTLLDLALDAELQDVDGESFDAVLTDGLPAGMRPVFWHSRKARPHSTGDMPASAVRFGDYKLIHFFADDRVELYDLAGDPGETEDLSEADPERTERMLAMLNAWRTQKAVSMKPGRVPKKKEKHR